ncbi:MAG: hypothetical protein O9331_19825 [Acidovorax sp.]|nr:hypothetical protein [Acidovorax sp.]
MESPSNDKNFESQHAVENDSSEVQIYHIFILNHFSQKYNPKLHACIHTTQHDAACQKTFAPDLSGGRHGPLKTAGRLRHPADKTTGAIKKACSPNRLHALEKPRISKTIQAVRSKLLSKLLSSAIS